MVDPAGGMFMLYEVKEMTMDDYDAVYSFWKTFDGLSIDESDERENMERYLRRNPHLSYVVYANEEVAATIKCGQDGRRGYIYHLAVKQEHRGAGLAKKLIDLCVEEFKTRQIYKCNLYVMDFNTGALSFWKHNGWNELDMNFKMLQKDLRNH